MWRLYSLFLTKSIITKKEGDDNIHIYEICCVFACLCIYTLIIYVLFYTVYIQSKTNKQALYKQEMQNAQNTAKQYKAALKSKKKGYKTLQKKYSCLEAENKCLKAKLCKKEK